MSDEAAEWTGVCTRCRCALAEETRLASREQPYCRTCWLVTFYGYPEDRLAQIMRQMAQAAAFGVSEEQRDRMLLGELLRHANRAVADKLQRIAENVPNPRWEAVRQAMEEARDGGA